MMRQYSLFSLLHLCFVLINDFQVGQARVATADSYQDSHLAEIEVDATAATLVTAETKDACSHALDRLIKENNLNHFQFNLHRNGEPEACGTASAVPLLMQQSLLETVDDFDCTDPEFSFDEYFVETFLTHYFAQIMSHTNPAMCGSTDDKSAPEGLLGFCDMGPKRTVIQADFEYLVRVPSAASSLPCRFYTREGWRISSLSQLSELIQKSSNTTETCEEGNAQCSQKAHSAALDLYAVPAGRVFMFAPSFVGEVFELDHVEGCNDKKIALTVMSLAPRVFDISNFFSESESDDLIAKALGETSDTHKFHRSTTGTAGASIYSMRTSENAWDTDGETSVVIKERCFKLLGFEELDEFRADGLQILRYNLTNAYIPHMDYLDRDTADTYDYDSSGRGGNRFATILLYMSDLEEDAGGETVFPNAWPVELDEKDRVQQKDAIEQLRKDPLASSVLKKGSWEEEMTALCRTRLAVKPYRTRAVLFYSQHPNGEPDTSSKHGSCPVLKGTKLAANLWTWNGIRPEYPGAPRKDGTIADGSNDNEQKNVSFRNTGQDKQFDNAELYYEESSFFGKLGPNDPPIHVNTYKGHKWNAKVDGKTVFSWVISSEKKQDYAL